MKGPHSGPGETLHVPVSASDTTSSKEACALSLVPTSLRPGTPPTRIPCTWQKFRKRSNSVPSAKSAKNGRVPAPPVTTTVSRTVQSALLVPRQKVNSSKQLENNPSSGITPARRAMPGGDERVVHEVGITGFNSQLD